MVDGIKRATTDEGKTLGSINNKECKIDSIAQSWATISEAGDNDKKIYCYGKFGGIYL